MNEILTVPELAEYLRVHSATVYRLLKAGKIPAFRVGFDWRFNRETIDKWMVAASSPVFVAEIGDIPPEELKRGKIFAAKTRR